MTRIVVSGAAGRMGRRIVELVLGDPATTLVGALEAASHPALGQPAAVLTEVGTSAGADVRITAELPGSLAADVVIDFSVPEQSLKVAALAAQRGWGVVVGTTGLDAAQKQEIDAAAARVAVLTA